MRKKILLLALTLLISVPTTVLALSSTEKDKDQKKERVENTRKEIEKKATKEARKAAKQFKKEGWKVNPGALPLEKQIDKSYQYKWEPLEDGSLAYFVGEGRAVGQTYDAAAQQARLNARQDISAKIGTDITTLIQNSVANKQLTSSEAATVSEYLEKTKAFVSQSLNNLTPVMECHRMLKNGNYEVMVSYAYSKAQAQQAVVDATRKTLEEKLNQ